MMLAADILSSRARLTPQREALLELATAMRYSYATLNERANRTAHWLRDYGVGLGDRVSILAHNSVVYVDLLFACAKIGAIFAPLNWRLAATELSYIVNDCRPTFLLFGPDFEATVAAMRPEMSVAHVVPLHLYEAAAAKRPSTEPPRPAELNGETTHCLLYTSGTTGRPKGAIIPQRQVLANAINTVVSWGLTAGDVSPIFTPMFHAGGLFVFLTPLFYVGGRIVLAREFDLEGSLQTIEQEGCTVILGVPTIFQMWLQSAIFPAINFTQVRWFVSGGAPCPLSLLQAWREATGRPFRQGYGLTEVGTNCFSMTNEEALAKAGSVGKSIFHSRMRLVDEAGNDVATGETGELIIAGPHVCAGYWHNPAATAEALRDGWFYTGDMAWQDEDGFFYIAGRYKDMIISGGENVYAAEVEAVFVAQATVAEAALIGQADDKWGEVGLMIVVLQKGQSATEAELLDFCRQRLASYKIPRRVIFADSLPYSPYGKVVKAELRERYLNEK